MSNNNVEQGSGYKYQLSALTAFVLSHIKANTLIVSEVASEILTFLDVLPFSLVTRMGKEAKYQSLDDVYGHMYSAVLDALKGDREARFWWRATGPEIKAEVQSLSLNEEIFYDAAESFSSQIFTIIAAAKSFSPKERANYKRSTLTKQKVVMDEVLEIAKRFLDETTL